MKTRLLLLFLLLTAVGTSAKTKLQVKTDFDVDGQLRYCNAQIHRALDELRGNDGSYNFGMEPRNILAHDRQKGWNCRPAIAEEWCGGFWPGILWMDYSAFKDKDVLEAAKGYTEALRHIAYEPVFDHDIGFLMFCSFGKGYDAITQTAVSQADGKVLLRVAENYKKVILASTDSLATLFNPMVGTLLSWPRNVRMFGGHNTIMDNMMNLELMFWASRNGGNPLLYDLAVAHAKTTMQHHFRPDGSCYHVAVYDSIDGRFIKGVTHQGFADSSMWARGQSWAIYYRNVPIDMSHGHQQTLVGMSEFEVIHEDILDVLTERYPLIKPLVGKDKLMIETAFKKWAENIIANGVPHNNWDLFQADFIMKIALVLDDDKQYDDGKGRQYYLDYICHKNSIRQWSIDKLIDFGFDKHAKTWYEAPGYSLEVLNRVWTADLVLTGVSRCDKDTVWQPLYGEYERIRDHYNEMTLHFSKGQRLTDGGGSYNKGKQYLFDIIVRAYNEVVAIRYHFPEAVNGMFMHITNDRTSFSFEPSTEAWHAAWAQAKYNKVALSMKNAVWKNESERPLLLKTPDNLYVAIGEAALHDDIDDMAFISAYPLTWHIG